MQENSVYLCEAVLHTSTNFLYLYLFIYLNFATMRKIELAMCEAVKNRKNWANGNTRVEIFNGELTVYLHGNAIYRIIDGVKYWTFAGWPTQTTKSRLRALGVDYKSENYGIYSWNKI